jgi:ethanolamine permease
LFDPPDVYFVGGMTAFMKMYPLTAWFYIGVESLGFCYNTVKDLHTDIPNGSIACVFTLFFFSIFILCVTCSLSPTGDLASAMSPLDVGNSLIYKIDPSLVIAFAIPATFATAFGFIFAYGKLICSLALSNLLPIELSHTTQRNSQPYAAMIAGSILGFFICLLAFYSPYIGLQLFNICVLSAFTCYVSQCVGFFLLKTKFLSLKRKFTSPLGVSGAFYAGSLYTLGIISVIAFQDDGQFAFIVFICIIALTSAYYYFVAPGQVPDVFIILLYVVLY